MEFKIWFFCAYTDGSRRRYIVGEISKYGKGSVTTEFFPFKELSAATQNFRPDCMVGEGGFGRVYKGHLESKNMVLLHSASQLLLI